MTHEAGMKLLDGKYEIILNQAPDDYQFKCLRHGEEWRDLVGDGMVLALVQTVEQLRAHVAEVKDLLALAKCPCCDGSGAYYDNHGEVCQCQWCYEKNKQFKSLQALRREAMEEMKQRMIEWVDDGTEWHDANDVIAALRNAPIGEAF